MDRASSIDIDREPIVLCDCPISNGHVDGTVRIRFENTAILLDGADQVVSGMILSSEAAEQFAAVIVSRVERARKG